LYGKKSLVKDTGFHLKETIWVKLSQLYHLSKMVKQFEIEGHELGVKHVNTKKKTSRGKQTNQLNVDEGINLFKMKEETCTSNNKQILKKTPKGVGNTRFSKQNQTMKMLNS
jgi:hypothetical protein